MRCNLAVALDLRQFGLIGVMVAADHRLPPGRSTFRLPGGEPGETRRTPGVMSSSLGIGVDLRTPNELSRYFRDQVLASAAVQYERE